MDGQCLETQDGVNTVASFQVSTRRSGSAFIAVLSHCLRDVVCSSSEAAELVAVYTLLANVYLRQRQRSPVHILQRFVRRILAHTAPAANHTHVPQPNASPAIASTVVDVHVPHSRSGIEGSGADSVDGAMQETGTPEGEPFEPFQVDRTRLLTNVLTTLKRQGTAPQSEYLQWVQHEW